MNEEQFEKRFSDFLEKFDELFETPEIFDNLAKEVAHDLKDKTDLERQLEFHRRLNFLRTNNLVRMALKEFLLND